MCFYKFFEEHNTWYLLKKDKKKKEKEKKGEKQAIHKFRVFFVLREEGKFFTLKKSIYTSKQEVFLWVNGLLTWEAVFGFKGSTVFST